MPSKCLPPAIESLQNHIFHTCTNAIVAAALPFVNGKSAQTTGFVISVRHCQFVQGSDKTYKPIASVAALRERHTGWQYTLHCFYGARSPDLSLRGPIGAVAISCNSLRFRRWLSCAPDGYCEIATSGFRPPRNDKPVCLTPPNHRPNTCYCQWRSLSAATDAIGACRFIGSLFASAALRRARLSAPLQLPTHKTAGRGSFPPAGRTIFRLFRFVLHLLRRNLGWAFALSGQRDIRVILPPVTVDIYAQLFADMAGAENAAVVVEVRDGAVAQLADHVARVQARIVGCQP